MPNLATVDLSIPNTQQNNPINTNPSQPKAQQSPTTKIGAQPSGAAGLYGANQANLQQLLNLAKPTLDNNNKLVDEKNAIYQHMYSAPLTDEQKKALTPGTKLAIESGQRSLMDAQIKAINSQLSGYTSGIDNSISDYMTAIAKMQENKDNIIKAIAANPEVAQLYGTDTLTKLGINASSVGVGVVGGYDMGNYATNPNNVNQLNQIYNSQQMQAVGNDAQSIQNYISQYAPNSPITGQMVMDVAQKTGVDPRMLLTVAQNESNFGTSGVATRTFNPGNVGNVDSGGTVNAGSWENGLILMANNLRGRYVGDTAGSASDSAVQAYVSGIQSGTIPSIAQVPAAYKTRVAQEMEKQGISSPLADSRYTMASSRITSQYTNLAGYQLAANGMPYLDRISAALETPGSVSDQDLLDSLTKLNTGGNAISDAQVRLITDGKSFSDMVNTFQNKFNSGGVLSNTQRKQIDEISKAIFKNYQKSYQPIYDAASKQLTEAGIPKEYWTIPDINSIYPQKLKDEETPSVSDSQAKNLIKQTSGDSNFEWYNPFTWF